MRALKVLALIALFAISFVTQGKAPRMPEMRGAGVLEMTQRAAGERTDGEA